MVKGMDPQLRERLIRDIAVADQDMMALGVKYGLNADEIAEWVNDPQTQRALTGLCVLADFQTQLLLSRYRYLAAGRLIQLATDQEAEGASDMARRACVDLLKLDVRPSAASEGEGGEPSRDVLDSLREALYSGVANAGGEVAAPVIEQDGEAQP